MCPFCPEGVRLQHTCPLPERRLGPELSAVRCRGAHPRVRRAGAAEIKAGAAALDGFQHNTVAANKLDRGLGVGKLQRELAARCQVASHGQDWLDWGPRW